MTAHQGIGAHAAVQGVGRAVAREHIVQRIASAVARGTAGEGEVFQIGTQRPTQAAAHRVRAFVGVLGHHIASVVHQVGIVALATQEGIGTRATVQGIGRVVARQGVAQRIASAVDSGTAR